MQKTILSLTILFACVMAVHARTYSTKFPATENPLSEGGNWINGQATGIGWKDCRSTPGMAFGTQLGAPVGPPYDDSTCVVSGSWGANQTVTATVHIVGTIVPQSAEVELRLRTTVKANSINGYEILCSVKPGNPYLQVVRWNGPLNSFTQIGSASTGCVNGDVFKANINGSTIQVFKNGTIVALDGHQSITDGTFSGGSPGIGFWNRGGTGANDNAAYGFSSFTATDGLDTQTPPAPPTNLAATVQ